MRNHLKLEYGKYLDGLTEEIPQADIILDESGTFSHELESGEPNVPTIDSTNVTLRNLDENNVEQYGYEAFWEAEARTSGEGGTFPLELYFRAKIKDTTVFTGVLNGIDYDRYKETCSVTVSDFLRAFKDDKRVMFKGFRYDDVLIANIVFTSPDITTLTAADGTTPLDFQVIEIYCDITTSTDPLVIPHLQSDFVKIHSDINDIIDANFPEAGVTPNFATTVWSESRNLFVQIGKVTLLTKVDFELFISYTYDPMGSPVFDFQVFFIAKVYCMKNTVTGFYGGGNNVIIEPGRFFNSDGSVLGINDLISVTFYDYDAYDVDSDILLKTSDVPATVPFIAGFSAVDTAGAWVLDETVSGATLDVLTKLKTILDREISAQFFDTIGSDTLFDFSLVDPDNYRSCFWADAIIHGWVGATAADVIRNALAQTSCYATADVNGVIKFIPRYGFSATLASGSYPTGTTVLQPEDFEPLDRVRYDRGYMAVEIDTPAEIIPVMNVKSDATIKTKVDQNGVVTSSKVRINSLPVRSYRTYETLQVPLQEDIDVFGMPLLRGEPATLTDYPSTAIEQAERYMEGKSYPRRTTSIAVNFEDYPIELGDFVAIENCPDTDYNGCWQVVSVTYDSTQPEILSKLALEFRGVKST